LALLGKVSSNTADVDPSVHGSKKIIQILAPEISDILRVMEVVVGRGLGTGEA